VDDKDLVLDRVAALVAAILENSQGILDVKAIVRLAFTIHDEIESQYGKRG